ncbi:hypothetical protein LOD99_9817 [Oopsacas minuta]|uniref:Uncharacterized protein n=1 Tax=Oopsacas minuta TaxID=111878 RepID=A0AAV7KMC6_9METZ|nr:hypothetical protein LOD99_9817 [Oopsacas minuta]
MRHSKGTASYPSNHGMLRIPKEINLILRCENSKQTTKDSQNTNTQDFWEKFNRCSSQLAEIHRHKETGKYSARDIDRTKMLCIIN